MNTENRDEVVQIHLDDIIPNRFQPREVFDEKALKELAVSIREHGVIQPIIVRNVNGKYEIIAGERRYKASALAGLTKIPAIIRDLDDKESSKVALLENLQRKNLNPIEEARTYQKILEIDEMTQEELAKTMGKSQSSVANKLRLLSLPEDVQEALLKEEISERHARALLMVPDVDVQKQLLEKVETTKMSVRALEDEIKALYPKEIDAASIPIEANAIASASGFLINEPLTPNVKEIEEETSNYGKVVIAPPKENNMLEEDSMANRFINYGEEENKEEVEAEDVVDMPVQPAGQALPNIATPGQEATALDNLLDTSGAQPQQAPAATPAPTQQESSIVQEGPAPQDYFDLKELPTIKIDEAVAQTPPGAPAAPSVGNPLPTIVGGTENYTPEQASQKIKDLITDLQQHGVRIQANEMNFPQSYQIIIKIDKPE